jgi:hypothetical protein
LTTSRYARLSVKRMRSALVLLCLLAFSIVSIVHAAHHVGAPAQDAFAAVAAPSGDDANASADAPAELAEMCLVCALTGAPIELFVFSAPSRTVTNVAVAAYFRNPVASSTEAPPPRA